MYSDLLIAMANTLVIQSHRSPLPYSWIESCLESVRHWCTLNQYDYQFFNDELFDNVPQDLGDKLKEQGVIASDLARLYALEEAINRGYEAAIWLDADFLIFDPEYFLLPDKPYAVGREVWVQHDRQNNLKIYKKVHNAFLLFRKGNSFLKFYRESAERLLRQNEGGMPPQFIGPKLLTALHNVAQLPVFEPAGMLSPLVIKDIVKGEGDALQHFINKSSVRIAGANLCISSCEKKEVTCADMEQAINALIENRLLL